jgi:citrate lyase subunit beta/citryl-CoA lyase
MRMTIRSFLFVPGDSEKKLAKGVETGADALILDLEDSVARSRKEIARGMVAEFLRSRAAPRRPQLWVRINPLDEGGLGDLAAIVGAAPDGVMLPKPDGPEDVVRLGHCLDALEAREGVGAPIRILPVATETARSVFNLGAYADHKLPRLFGLTWGAEDLSSAIGASTNKGEDGDFAFTYRMVRSHCLLAAKAAGVEAIETLQADFRDEAGLRASSIAARKEGFTGRMAIHPAQVGPINEGFLPTAEEVAFAERVVAAFAENPEAGTLALDSKMLDVPHLKQAQKILAMHAAHAG